MTAWLNYHLLLKEEYYSIVFGDQLDQDIALNLIRPEIVTRVRNFQVLGIGVRVFLSWEVDYHRILGDYAIIRREPGLVYPVEPYAELLVTGVYTDPAVIPGQQYEYTVCSYDLEGNQQECSQVLAITAGEGEAVFLPLINTP